MLTYLLFAQAAAATDAVVKLPETAIIKPRQTWLTRFEESTGLPSEVAVWGVNILAAAAILFIGYVAAGIARRMVRQLLTKRHIDETVAGFVGNLSHAAIMTFVVISALGQVGVDTKTFAAVIAAAGLAIGLALQGGLSNFAAGFLIVVFRPFRKGDVVNAAGIEGTVEEVEVFSTTLNTADNKKIIVPNSSIMGATITNYTANPTRRIDLQVGVGAASDLAKAHATLIEVAKALPAVLKNPAPEVANVKLIDGGTMVELRAWTKTPDYGATNSQILATVPPALAAAGIKGPDKSVIFVERK